jgi:outer membrane receptor protein involved in Fe transport
MNIGYDQQGNEADSYNMSNGTSPPGEPTIMGAYVQDKIELEDLVLNVGVRFDRFDFGSEAPESWDNLYLSGPRIDHDPQPTYMNQYISANDDTSTPDVNEGDAAWAAEMADPTSDVLEQYNARATGKWGAVDPYTYISPRIGISFPVSDKTVLHAQYGKFVQHPILNRLYLSDSRFAANQTQGNMVESPNGALKPERTIQYEVGFAQQLGGFAAIDLTGYYKEVRDYTMLSNRNNATINGAEFSWAQFSNGDYGVVKGLSAALKMRRLNGVLIDVNYTYQTANGTGSDPSSNFMIAWTGENYPKSINPLDFDQRHTGSVMVDYQAGRIAGLFNLDLNATYQFGSGTAYTPSTLQSAVFGRGWYEPVAAINSGFQPWTSMMDLRINFGNIAGLGVSAYILVLNALNTENVVSVYPGTGSAGEDGWLNTSEGEVWLKGNPIGESFYEDRLRNPSRWQNPRMIRVGVAYSL